MNEILTTPKAPSYISVFGHACFILRNSMYLSSKKNLNFVIIFITERACLLWSQGRREMNKNIFCWINIMDAIEAIELVMSKRHDWKSKMSLMASIAGPKKVVVNLSYLVVLMYCWLYFHVSHAIALIAMLCVYKLLISPLLYFYCIILLMLQNKQDLCQSTF